MGRMCVGLVGAVMVAGIGVLPVPPAAASTATMSLELRGDDPLPDTPHGEAARAFIAMFLHEGDDPIRLFDERHRTEAGQRQVPIEERIRRIGQMRQEHGRLEATEVLEDTADTLTILARDAHGRVLVLGFNFSGTEPGRVDGVLVSVGDGSTRPQVLTAAQIEEVVQGVCRTLEGEYVFPEVAKAMAEDVRTRLRAGEYGGSRLETSLARKLQADLRALCRDKHLSVVIEPQGQGRGDPVAYEAAMARGNYGFKRVEVLAGNVGYVRLDGFAQQEEAKEVATAAMQFVGRCDAVIFDLRFNGGGSPEMIRFLTSYLYAEPTHLNSMVDRSGATVEEYWTLEEVPGTRLRPGIPVYVLTSGSTFSGAEEFTYNLKNLKRATVIGETTGGGAHPVKAVRITDRIQVIVPFMRAMNPISKTNWEGTGVTPDIEVPADQALDRALEHARTAASGGPPAKG